MKLKLCTENEQKIVAALAAVNGKAYDHTFTSLWDVKGVVERAEKRLLALVQFKKFAAGAKYKATSGERVASAYKYSRKATYLELERGASAWFIVSCASTEVYLEGGNEVVVLTQAQHQVALSLFSTRYTVAA